MPKLQKQKMGYGQVVLTEIGELPCLPLESKRFLPKTSGIYFALTASKAILYIGASRNLHQRWNSGCHHQTVGLFQRECSILAWQDAPVGEIEHLERRLINLYRPPLNTVVPKEPSLNGIPQYLTCPQCHGEGTVENPAYRGQEMRRLRQAAGLSLREVARQMKLSAAYVSDLELGRRAWSKRLINDYGKAIK